MTPLEFKPEQSPEPFWSYRDVLLFIGITFPSLLVAATLVRLVHRPLHLSEGFADLLSQSIWYIFVFGFLVALFRLAYHRPFWRSLGFSPPFRHAGLWFGLGPILAIGLSYIGYLLNPIVIESPFDQLLVDRPTTILFVIFGVVVGPLCEELAFRGFLMPLLMRTFGTATGILSTAVLFGALHAPEYHKVWQYAFLIGTAGAVFGYVRYRTGSTASATFMHIGYNLIQFVALWIRSGGPSA